MNETNIFFVFLKLNNPVFCEQLILFWGEKEINTGILNFEYLMQTE